MENTIFIYSKLIEQIIGLLAIRVDNILLLRKSQEKPLGKKETEKFVTLRGSRGFSVAHINYKAVRFMVQILACKLIRKSH